MGMTMANVGLFYPPSQKTTGVSPWLNAGDGPFEARRAKEGASADSAEDNEGYHGCKPVEASLKSVPQGDSHEDAPFLEILYRVIDLLKSVFLADKAVYVYPPVLDYL